MSTRLGRFLASRWGGLAVGAAIGLLAALRCEPWQSGERGVQVGGLSAAGMWAVMLGLALCLAISFGMREKQW